MASYHHRYARRLWRTHHGPGSIPSGHQIHHKDGNPANNVLANLECLSPKAHAAKHPQTNHQYEHLEKVRPLAAHWHRSPAGRQWHRAHATASWKDRQSVSVTCQQCGTVFMDLSHHARFCSPNCKAAARRQSGVDETLCICTVCERLYSANRYASTLTCSRACGARRRFLPGGDRYGL